MHFYAIIKTLKYYREAVEYLYSLLQLFLNVNNQTISNDSRTFLCIDWPYWFIESAFLSKSIQTSLNHSLMWYYRKHKS